MSDMVANERVIWVLKGVRAGDTAQALALAERLGGKVVEKSLTFNASHILPNWLMGRRLSHLKPQARQDLLPPWPDLVIATGRRTAPVSAWIRKASAGFTKTIHLGRPRMAFSAFDLVVTTPQYGFVDSANCFEVPVPIHRSMAVQNLSVPWSNCPRPWLLAVVGGGKYPQRMAAADLARYASSLNHFQTKAGGSIILLDAPRTRDGDVKQVGALVTAPHWVSQGRSSTSLYISALHHCDALAVTSDSVSIVSDMLAMRKPTWVYALPRSRFALKWQANAGFARLLSNRGILQPPRDVAGFFSALIDNGFVGDLAAGKPARMVYDSNRILNALVARINQL
jgi:uncharacterized protein